jgi:hypothetical protein
MAMCMNCLTGTELAVMQGTALVAFTRMGLTRAHEMLTGRDPMVRRLAAHRANAEFLAGMGLDPALVLDPPPSPAAIAGHSGRVRLASAPASLAAAGA